MKTKSIVNLLVYSFFFSSIGIATPSLAEGNLPNGGNSENRLTVETCLKKFCWKISEVEGSGVCLSDNTHVCTVSSDAASKITSCKKYAYVRALCEDVK